MKRTSNANRHRDDVASDVQLLHGGRVVFGIWHFGASTSNFIATESKGTLQPLEEIILTAVNLIVAEEQLFVCMLP